MTRVRAILRTCTPCVIGALAVVIVDRLMPPRPAPPNPRASAVTEAGLTNTIAEIHFDHIPLGQAIAMVRAASGARIEYTPLPFPTAQGNPEPIINAGPLRNVNALQVLVAVANHPDQRAGDWEFVRMPLTDDFTCRLTGGVLHMEPRPSSHRAAWRLYDVRALLQPRRRVAIAAGKSQSTGALSLRLDTSDPALLRIVKDCLSAMPSRDVHQAPRLVAGRLAVFGTPRQQQWIAHVLNALSRAMDEENAP